MAEVRNIDIYTQVAAKARNVYEKRDAIYRGNWRRYGWRGCLYDLRRKVERAWDGLWDAEEEPDEDDLIDAINYAIITVMALREGNRDGEGGWWS